MQVMADYLEEAADVQNAAADEYQAAVSGYLGATSESAQSYAAAITAKINAYKAGQNTKYTVNFSGFSGSVASEGCISWDWLSSPICRVTDVPSRTVICPVTLCPA